MWSVKTSGISSHKVENSDKKPRFWTCDNDKMWEELEKTLGDLPLIEEPDANVAYTASGSTGSAGSTDETDWLMRVQSPVLNMFTAPLSPKFASIGCSGEGDSAIDVGSSNLSPDGFALLPPRAASDSALVQANQADALKKDVDKMKLSLGSSPLMARRRQMHLLQERCAGCTCEADAPAPDHWPRKLVEWADSQEEDRCAAGFLHFA
jgi:hypothetical protein